MNARDRKALVLGAGVIGTCWLALRAVPGVVLEMRGIEAELEQRADLVARARTRVGALDELADSIARVETLARTLPRLVLSGRDMETASVDLMRRTTDAVGQWATFEAFDERAAGPRSGPLQMLTLRARFETDLSGLMEIVRGIEVDSVLSIESLRVEARNPHAPARDPERLTALLRVGAWYLTNDTTPVAAGGSQ